METIPANPFKGLRPYSQQDRDKLFGRDRDLILMKDRIFSARTTLLFAGSGVGKTSFLNAKVIPELKKQCAVVWHNRWTGADEIQDDVEARQDHLRFWPPRVLIRELIRKFRSLRSNELSVSPAPRDPLAQTDDAFELEVRKVISQNLRPATTEKPQRLSEVLACFSKSANPDAMNRCVLILDQFEEVFQYHAYEDYFRDFVKDLCDVINNDDYQVRVVFSMREEFLGELSVFDNRIPDLFSNYYRLRYPDKEEAEDIIRRTCQLSGVDPDEDKLPSLVEDLSKIAKGSGSFAERATNKSEAGVHVIKRDFVAPPYLQIACERLWNKQYAKKGSKNGPTTTITGKLQNSFRFLSDYHAGVDGSGATGGDAQQAVVSFCEEKLSPPFLSRTEQDIIANAFSFLVTKQGAKMAYELSSLADHMRERVRPLKKTLEKLSQDQAKILRESRGPDRSYWFELYHDMYATIVDAWKVRYQAERRRRRWIIFSSTMLIGLLLVIAYVWIVLPQDNRKQLESFKDQACGNQDQYAEAVSAFTTLSNTWGYRRTANSLWAQILERQAQCFEKNSDPSSAILTLLKAATMEHDDEARRRMATAAATLMGAPNGSLIATYCDDCDTATLSPDGKSVLSMNLDGHVRLWDADTGQPRGEPFCPDCRQSRPAARKAIFSSDGKQVLTVAGVRRCEEGSDNTTASETGLQIQIWDATHRTPILPKPLCLIDKAEPEARRTTGQTFGKESGQEKPGGVPPSIDIRAVAKAGEKFWIAGVRGSEILVWDAQGNQQTMGASRNPAVVGVTFSPDGLYLAGLFGGESIRLWRVSESQFPSPYPFKNSLAIAFGPQHQLLTAEKGNIVKLIDLDSGKTLLSVNVAADLPPDTELQNIGFSPSGNQFVTRLRTNEGDVVRAWHTANGQALSSPLSLLDRIARSGLSGDGLSLLAIADGAPPVIEKWDLQTGQLAGAIKRKFDSATFRPDRHSIMILEGTTARLWGFDDSAPGRILRGRSLDPFELDGDGKILLTINNGIYFQFWNTDTGSAISEAIPLSDPIRLATISADGNYAATDTEDGKVQVWQTARLDPIATFSSGGESQTMALSADGKTLARAEWSDLRIWKVPAQSGIELHGHTGNIVDVALTNEVAITASSDKTARLWNTTTGQMLHVLSHEDLVTAVAISRDGNHALTGSNDGVIRLWDVKNGAPLGEIRVKDSIRRLMFSSEGNTCAILTSSWAYLAKVKDGALTYQTGVLIADPWWPALNLTPDGKKLRFAYVFGADAVQVQDLDLEPAAAADQLAKNPEQALKDWQRRLGLRVGDLGLIGRLWEDEQLADTEQSYPKKAAQ